MVPEEDEVPLVVEGDHPSAPELWVMGEEGSKHAPHCVAQTSGQVVQNNLWNVTGWPAMTLRTQETRCIYTRAHTSYTVQYPNGKLEELQHSSVMPPVGTSMQRHIPLPTSLIRANTYGVCEFYAQSVLVVVCVRRHVSSICNLP